MVTEQQKLEIALSLSPHDSFNSNEISEFINENISLGPRQYEVFFYLVELANNCNGVCFPSGECLAKSMGISRPRIMQIIKSLKEKGLLLVEQLEKGGSNFYIIPTIEHLINLVEGWLNEVKKKAMKNIKEQMDKVAEKASEIVETLVVSAVQEGEQ